MTITVEGPGGATVEFPEGTPTETINKVMTDHFGGGKKEASGLADGMVHGAKELINGPAETLKRFAGVGTGRKNDPNYVPANVTNGSWNPANWSPSQLPQKIAEMAPSVVPDIASATAGAKLGKRIGPKSALAGALIGGTLSALGRTAGDTAKEATVARTGDENAESSAADLTRGGLTAAAGAGVNALLPTRFVPGLNKAGTVGAQGALDAVKRYLGTTAIGGAGAVASDATTQAGLTVGTPKGLTVDPSSFPESAVGGAATAGTLAVPQLASQAYRAKNMREFGGDNTEATKNYATRLQTAGEGVGGLGNAKRDSTAQQLVKGDLTNELGDAARAVRQSVKLSPDADNALQRAQTDKTITPNDLALIERETAGTPDGANAAYLARTLRMAQLAQAKGSYSSKGWAGGLSGTLEANLGYMLNPTRIMGGAAASAMGMHLLGLSNPMFAGGVAGGYGVARGIDSAFGTRSPAKTFAEHFADQSAQLRQPTTPSAPAPNQGPAPSAPWGPRPPMAGPTGPTVMPPAAPQQNAPQGPWGPRPLATASVPPTGPQAPAPAPAPDPMAAAKAMLQQRAYMETAKRNSAEPEAPAAPAAPERIKGAAVRIDGKLYEGVGHYEAIENASRTTGRSIDALTDSVMGGDLDGFVTSTGRYVSRKEAHEIAKSQDQYKAGHDPADGEAFTEMLDSNKIGEPQSASSAGQDTSAILGASKLKAKITKKNGKVNTEGGGESVTRNPYDPIEETRLYPKGIRPEAYGRAEADAYLGPNVPPGRRETYMASAEATARENTQTIEGLKSHYPEFTHAFDGLLRQLLKLGGKQEKKLDAVHHYAGLLSPDAGSALKKAFH